MEPSCAAAINFSFDFGVGPFRWLYRVPYVQTINSFFCPFPALVSAQLFRQQTTKKLRRGGGTEPVSWLPIHLAKVDARSITIAECS